MKEQLLELPGRPLMWTSCVLRFQPQYWSDTAHEIFRWGRNLSMAVYNTILFSFIIVLCR
jgi:hypothetical protein